MQTNRQIQTDTQTDRYMDINIQTDIDKQIDGALVKKNSNDRHSTGTTGLLQSPSSIMITTFCNQQYRNTDIGNEKKTTMAIE